LSFNRLYAEKIPSNENWKKSKANLKRSQVNILISHLERIQKKHSYKISFLYLEMSTTISLTDAKTSERCQKDPMKDSGVASLSLILTHSGEASRSLSSSNRAFTER